MASNNLIWPGILVLYNQERLFLIRPFQGHSVDLDTFVLPWPEIAALRITTYGLRVVADPNRTVKSNSQMACPL